MEIDTLRLNPVLSLAKLTKPYSVHLFVFVAMCSDATVLETWRQVSSTPVYLEILNWPPHVRATFEGMMLAALLPPSIQDYQVRVRV